MLIKRKKKSICDGNQADMRIVFAFQNSGKNYMQPPKNISKEQEEVDLELSKRFRTDPSLPKRTCGTTLINYQVYYDGNYTGVIKSHPGDIKTDALNHIMGLDIYANIKIDENLITFDDMNSDRFNHF